MHVTSAAFSLVLEDLLHLLHEQVDALQQVLVGMVLESLDVAYELI